MCNKKHYCEFPQIIKHQSQSKYPDRNPGKYQSLHNSSTSQNKGKRSVNVYHIFKKTNHITARKFQVYSILCLFKIHWDESCKMNQYTFEKEALFSMSLSKSKTEAKQRIKMANVKETWHVKMHHMISTKARSMFLSAVNTRRIIITKICWSNTNQDASSNKN